MNKSRINICENCAWLNIEDAQFFCNGIRAKGHKVCDRFLLHPDKEKLDGGAVIPIFSGDKEK